MEYTSTYRRERNDRRALVMKWAYVSFIGFVALIFSGAMHYLAIQLPQSFIMFLFGVWFASAGFIAMNN